MPQLGHALVALGTATATETAPRAQATRAAWVGGCLLLAYAPDLIEWGMLWIGWLPIHGGPSGLPIMLPLTAVVLACLRFGLGERSWLALGVVAVMLLSHSLLDLLDGGIPLRWPFSRDVVGGDVLGLTRIEAGGRLAAELRRFVPLACLGIALRLWTASPSSWTRWSAVSALAISLATAPLDAAPWLQVIALSVSIAAYLGSWTRTRWKSVGWQVTLALPLLAMGLSQAYAWHQMRLADAHYLAGRPAAAIPHYRQARRLRPVDLTARAIYREADSLTQAGQYAAAHALFWRGIRASENPLAFRDGLARLYFSAEGTPWHQPREAVALLERLLAHPHPPAYRRYLEDQMKLAQAAVAKLQDQSASAQSLP